ncbi:MAG: helix-turn-helix domain-containing protein [Balneolales bacterium]
MEKTNLQLLRPKDVCKLLNISVPTLYRWQSEGKFEVRKIHIGPNSVAYRQSDVQTWLEKKSE